VIGFYEPGESALSPQHTLAVLATSVYFSNSPVLKWSATTPIELDGVTLELVSPPTVERFQDGFRTELSLNATLQVPEVRLGASPSWPYDYSPNPIPSTAVVGRSLGPYGSFWSGAAVTVAADTMLHTQCTTSWRPERIVAEQRGIIVDGRRHLLLAAMDL